MGRRAEPPTLQVSWRLPSNAQPRRADAHRSTSTRVPGKPDWPDDAAVELSAAISLYPSSRRPRRKACFSRGRDGRRPRRSCLVPGRLVGTDVTLVTAIRQCQMGNKVIAVSKTATFPGHLVKISHAQAAGQTAMPATHVITASSKQLEPLESNRSHTSSRAKARPLRTLGRQGSHLACLLVAR